MQMSELIHFLHVGAADADDGGGHFLLTLSDESLTDDKRGPGLNLLYGKPKDLLGHNDEKSYAHYAERRQRWYTATTRPMPAYIAKFWHANFDREGFMSYVDRQIKIGVRQDWLPILRANGYDVSITTLPETLADLFTTGLANLAEGRDLIDDRPWDTSLINATSQEPVKEVLQKQRFADLKPADIYVEGNELVVGAYRVQMPAQKTVPTKPSAFERKYTNQLIRLLCEECGIEVSIDSLRENGGDYLEDFNIARQDYYLADGLREVMKDSSLDGEAEFEKIKDDTYSGVRPTHRKKHASPYERMQATLEQAANVPLTKSHVPEATGLFHTEHRHGITHMLVNDERLKWVDDDN
ncbi:MULTISPECIES: ABC-three component system protein [Actinomycetaceae]|uniref:ABC-three component system protein n=1 Tax=Actinomycetaceae TaxID=2049 RepID=UPI0008A64FB9|nr:MULTISPECIES: ABC-three component system protein [Actinomycetaceae]MBS6101335.1 hypothetical protein [Actinomyces sp.]MDU7238679.1 ABC-three component system protein [Actinomyces sp.]OFS66129.1 hypothetical protein HMPREF3174_05900 [Trueperella sp. HMSC08H06]